MGRQSLTNVAHPRTVDDDLAANNMTRQDLSIGPYNFKRVWAKLRSQGWHAKNGPKLGYDHYYIKPGKDITDVEGVDFFYGEAAVSLYGRDIGLFEEEDGEPSPSKITMAMRPAPSPLSSEGDNRRRASVDSAGNGRAASSTSAERKEVKASASGRDEKKKRSRVPTNAVKKEAAEKKPSDKGKQKMKRVADVKPRQWPDSHPSKGRHLGDAICLLDSDDDDDEENLEEKAPAVKVEAVKEEGSEGKRPASAKPTKLSVEEDEDDEDDEEDDEDGSIGHDSVGDDSSAMEIDEDMDESEESESGSSSARQKKRPKLTTRATKRQKQKPITTGGANNKSQYEPQSLKAGKIKSGPRGLMFDAHSSFKTHAQDETPPPALKKITRSRTRKQETPAQRRPPPQAASKPRVVQGLASQFDGVAVMPEPEPSPAFSPPSPPSRPASRASSVASSHRSYATSTRASLSRTARAASRPIVRLDVDGVTFKSFPDEKYHVVITEDIGSSHTTILMEERTSKVQMNLTFSDITQHSEPPKNANGLPQTAPLVYQALSLLLKRASETVTVDNPPPGVTMEDDGSPFADFDLVRDDSSTEIVMEFPNMFLLTQVHRFPMTQLSESPRVQALLSELERTKQELEQTRRDMEAFQKLHAQLERDYEKFRKSVEQQQRRPQNNTPPPQPQPVAAPRPPVSPVPVPAVVPVPSPSPRGKDAITFHGQSSWLGTAHSNAAAVGNLTTWALKWERIIEASANHYEVVAGEAASTVVKFIMRGSYQLNLNVIHEIDRKLTVTITSKGTQRRQVTPSTIQIIETKNKTMHRSRVDKIIHCDVDDTIAVQLQKRNAMEPLHGKVMGLTGLSAQANKWLMHFLDRQCLLTGKSNGVPASQ